MNYSIKKIFDLKNIYFIVFMTLAGWAIFAYFTMTNMITNQEIYATIINLSGKQRMLSQKTTLIAKRYYESRDQKLKLHLHELIKLMEKDHKYIINNLTSKKTKEIYFSKPIYLDKQVTDYIKLLNSFYKTLDEKYLNKIEQISFKLLPQLNTAVNIFEKESNQRTKELLIRERFILFGTLFTLILEALVIVIPSIKRANKKEKQLNELNNTLKKRINKAIEENRKKEKLLEHQFHISQMTEMMSNIAHQWRQPLSVISTMASGLKLEKELGMDNDKKTIDKLDNITNKTTHLSSTIDSFIDFLKNDSQSENININKNIERTLFILNSTLEYNKIDIKKDFTKEDINIIGDPSKLSQVFLIILTNAKDFLLENQIKNKWISIKTYKKDNCILVEIEDNAGGIKEDIIDKIFNIYFTTKHQSQGTGLGLYISYEILKKNFKGEIKASNTKNGALFTVRIPIV